MREARYVIEKTLSGKTSFIWSWKPESGELRPSYVDNYAYGDGEENYLEIFPWQLIRLNYPMWEYDPVASYRISTHFAHEYRSFLNLQAMKEREKYFLTSTCKYPIDCFSMCYAVFERSGMLLIDELSKKVTLNISKVGRDDAALRDFCVECIQKRFDKCSISLSELQNDSRFQKERISFYKHEIPHLMGKVYKKDTQAYELPNIDKLSLEELKHHYDQLSLIEANIEFEYAHKVDAQEKEKYIKAIMKFYRSTSDEMRNDLSQLDTDMLKSTLKGLEEEHDVK